MEMHPELGAAATLCLLTLPPDLMLYCGVPAHVLVRSWCSRAAPNGWQTVFPLSIRTRASFSSSQVSGKFTLWYRYAYHYFMVPVCAPLLYGTGMRAMCRTRLPA